MLYQLSYLPLTFMYVCDDNAAQSVCQRVITQMSIVLIIIAQLSVPRQEANDEFSIRHSMS